MEQKHFILLKVLLIPKFTGPKSGTKEKWEFLDEDKKYSWIKSPTFKGKTAEVGPLAKYIVVYTKVNKA